MFDIGFSELFVIGIVALIVIGPERLPRVARIAGHFFGRAQRYVSTVKSEINREMQLDDLKKLQSEMQNSMFDLKNTFTEQLQNTEQEIKDALPKRISLEESVANAELKKDENHETSKNAGL